MEIIKNCHLIIFSALSSILIWMSMSQIARSQSLSIAGLTLTDVQTGNSFLLSSGTDSATVFVFLSPECPLCQSYTKTIRELSTKYRNRVRFIGVFPGNSYSREKITSFVSRYQLQIPAFLDADFSTANAMNVSVTPTVVFVKQSKLVYFGAIDNWASGLGKKRNLITEHYLADAIAQSLSHQIVTVVRTEPIGCGLNMY
ncbi:redoxin family protein [Parapedobacter sp. GCM10030251]|uniref:redoxin family protein n=1 Tax=Parapedobacter sp. GCM10030251 TaxID=3273419 RepID=UPI003615578C